MRDRLEQPRVPIAAQFGAGVPIVISGYFGFFSISRGQICVCVQVSTASCSWTAADINDNEFYFAVTDDCSCVRFMLRGIIVMTYGAMYRPMDIFLWFRRQE